MIEDEIIEMARQAGFRVGPSRDGPDDVWGVGANLKRFAKLLAEKEQPTQVKLTDDEIFKIYIAVIREVYKNPLSNDPMEKQAAISFARAIEAAHGIKE
jgi:hypothetical protein